MINEVAVVEKKNKAIKTIKAEDNTPQGIIRSAFERGFTPEQIKDLLLIQERWEANEARKAFNVAMSEFKANAPKIIKDKGVSFGQGKAAYKYAKLDQVAGKIAAEMSKHGLSASWRTDQTELVSVTTRISHIKGHFEETTLKAPADVSGNKNSLQAIGSTISYLQRYGLLCIAGLAAADMDDDGESSSMVFIDDKELSQIVDMVNEYKVDEAKFLSYMKCESLAKMPKSKYQQAITALQARAKK